MMSLKTLISQTLKSLNLLKEINHCIKPDAIDHITPLRRNPTTAEYHSIIVFSKYPEELNTWIERGFSINYQIYRTERYTKRMQLIQCFNCYGYGHHAKICQAKTRCGKCGEFHETQKCKSTTIKCCQCKGPHEAWHYKCPIRLMKRKTLREIRHQLPHKFIVAKNTFQESEEEEEKKEKKRRRRRRRERGRRRSHSQVSGITNFHSHHQNTTSQRQASIFRPLAIRRQSLIIQSDLPLENTRTTREKRAIRAPVKMITEILIGEAPESQENKKT